MAPNLTDALCTKCGLCCDGTLFGDVELSGWNEAIQLEVLGLDIEDADGKGTRALLQQPCNALQGTRCGIYAHRPKCCRTYECVLLQDAQRGVVPVELAQQRIAEALRRARRARALLSQLGDKDSGLPLKERAAEALSKEPSSDQALNEKRVELSAEMSALGKLLRKSFLGHSWR